MPSSLAHPGVPTVPRRERGGLVWSASCVDVATLQEAGWTVYSFRDLRERYITPARSRGTARTTLANPAQPLLDLVAATPALAVVGVSLRTAADLRDLYGYLVEPAFRRGTSLLVASDRDLDDLDPADFVDVVGFPWSLERLRYIAARFALGPGPAGLPPLTPIEALLYDAMRSRDLAPVAQYGIGRYRADFAFPDVRLVVECDGRPWHDPDRDRRRDADLRRKGWEPLHFTGSEITNNASGCASRVEHEIRARRATAESEQPDVLVPIPPRRWWRRLLDSLGALFAPRGVPPAVAGVEVAERTEERVTPGWAADLDPEQRAAVQAHDGVVQVIAPAGSGKTTVLVARVRELVSRGVPANRILCCTFNTAAAEELQTRLDQAGVEAVQASTFHAVGRRILKRAELLRREVGSFSYGQWRRLAKLAMDATPDGVWIEAPDARDQVSGLKLGRMLSVEEFESIASGPAEQTLATLYRLYEEELAAQDRNDFDDFICGAVRLLQRDAAARRHWQGEFSAVLVDEYQDIEPAQELLVQILAAPEDLLLCVGDEDQCLYAWRRASVERVIELDQLYPGLERRALARNYRCPSRIVDASRALIGRNRRRFPKEIVAARTEPGQITLVGATDLRAQAAHAARVVADLHQGEVVILARTARVLSEMALGLAEAGVRFFGPERIKGRSGEPAVLLAYLRVLGSPERARPEDVDLVFRVPNRYLPDDAEVNVASALRSGLTFSQALARLRVREEWRRTKLTEAGRLFDALAGNGDAADLVHRLRTDGGLDRHYAGEEQLSPTDKSAVDALARAEETAVGMTVVEFADALDYRAHIIEQHFDEHGVELATIHGAKGRQWPLVILAGAEEDELPHARSVSYADDVAGELEGERRLAYVAFTRASERLILLHEQAKPSRFIAEAALRLEPLSQQATQPMTTPAGAARTTAPAARLGDFRFDPVRADPPPWTAIPRAPSRPLAAPVLLRSAHPRPDGSIPCSMPGCSGLVGPAFVCGVEGAYFGLCARFEVHEALAKSDPACEAIWVELKRAGDEARRRWRATSGDGVDDEIRCALPGCEGVVNPEYAYEVNGEFRGLCGQRMFHDALARRDSTVKETLLRLIAEQNAARRAGDVGPLDLRSALLDEGGIACSVPGCDGIVAPRYIVRSDEGPVGICGMQAAHERLARWDPAARRALQQVGALLRDR